MRFLFICTARAFAGLEILTLELMSQLRQDGHAVHCLTHTWVDHRFRSALVSRQIPFSQFDLGWIFLRHPWWTVQSLRALPRARREFRALLSDVRPDVQVHVAYHSILMLRGLDQRAIYHVHDAHDATPKHRLLFALFRSRLMGAIAVSGFVAGKLAALGIPRTRLRVVHNGVTVPAVDRGRESSGERVVRVGIVGQVRASKGHEVLLRALAIVRSQRADFRCLVFGEGAAEYLDQLRQLAATLGVEGAVEWRGFVHPADAIYQELDVLVVAGIEPEAFGLTLAEAGARGLPVVAPDFGASAEIVEDGTTGLLFRPGDPRDLAAKLLQLADAAQRKRMGAAAARRIAATFTTHHMAREFAVAARELAAPPP